MLDIQREPVCAVRTGGAQSAAAGASQEIIAQSRYPACHEVGSSDRLSEAVEVLNTGLLHARWRELDDLHRNRSPAFIRALLPVAPGLPNSDGALALLLLHR